MYNSRKAANQSFAQGSEPEWTLHVASTTWDSGAGSGVLGGCNKELPRMLATSLRSMSHSSCSFSTCSECSTCSASLKPCLASPPRPPPPPPPPLTPPPALVRARPGECSIGSCGICVDGRCLVGLPVASATPTAASSVPGRLVKLVNSMLAAWLCMCDCARRC